MLAKNHLVRQQYNRKVITNAIKRLKFQHPSALLTVENLAAVYEMIEMQDDPAAEEETSSIEWVEDQAGHDRSVAFKILDECKQIEQYFSSSSLLHGTETDRNDFKDVQAFHTGSYERIYQFPEIIIDTCANAASVTGFSQYRAYCHTFMFPCSIEQSQKRILRKIGGYSKAIG